MVIRDIMIKDILKVRDNATLKDALKIMTSDTVNSAPVVNDKDELVGIVVKADIYRFLIEEGHYDSYPVEAVMTKNVISVNASNDIVEVGKILRDNNIFAVPVVEDSKAIGIVTLEEVLDYFLEK
ncbi:CBS domain-containing protein [Clostridium felsineum]|uniref:A-adding tRNA nucleotidyltransferase n=1 Tax=Clostridium felsineum TaxID=36839 RepID=A0A1S8LJJ1_9CLOT|nr:CBS domain-containing protein [Clostridium felsineum]MCR3760073.1 CBS domain-containing protein [Clostridium felsineum]URZ01387.1 A-adding tRNA nucleotidyltransferase [Clostridium felsineum]URZ05769.1 A-adding tRNA nucleotidyltransferase [Clostridium felsineum]URZ10808.1 A-adding tRNA nucleotidyltransferase [Clostridium felsineum]